MVQVRSFASALVASFLVGQAIAHPEGDKSPEDKKREAAAFHEANLKLSRALKACASSPEFVARQERAIARRAATADKLRRKRGIENKAILHGKRDEAALEKWLGISHDQSDLGYSLDTPTDVLFSGNASCVLASETTIGPYWVEGEYIRTDIAEDEGGVPLHLDVQVVDINTCLAVSDLVVDIWHTNALGVYSGVSASGQGGLDSTFNRGAQISDEDGIVEFDTIFPGHYTGRTTHIHVLATANDYIYPNQTYDVGIAQHIGQFFFDESLIQAVEQTSPYTQNQQSFVGNANDGIAEQAATDEYDIFLDYALLGDEPADGLLSWVVVGIDPNADHTSQVSAAAHYYEGGGVDNGNGGGPGGPPSKA